MTPPPLTSQDLDYFYPYQVAVERGSPPPTDGAFTSLAPQQPVIHFRDRRYRLLCFRNEAEARLALTTTHGIWISNGHAGFETPRASIGH